MQKHMTMRRVVLDSGRRRIGDPGQSRSQGGRQDDLVDGFATGDGALDSGRRRRRAGEPISRLQPVPSGRLPDEIRSAQPRRHVLADDTGAGPGTVHAQGQGGDGSNALRAFHRVGRDLVDRRPHGSDVAVVGRQDRQPFLQRRLLFRMQAPGGDVLVQALLFDAPVGLGLGADASGLLVDLGLFGVRRQALRLNRGRVLRFDSLLFEELLTLLPHLLLVVRASLLELLLFQTGLHLGLVQGRLFLLLKTLHLVLLPQLIQLHLRRLGILVVTGTCRLDRRLRFQLLRHLLRPSQLQRSFGMR